MVGHMSVDPNVGKEKLGHFKGILKEDLGAWELVVWCEGRRKAAQTYFLTQGLWIPLGSWMGFRGSIKTLKSQVKLCVCGCIFAYTHAFF